MRYLVTGCAGFIGSAICHDLLQKNHEVLGVDRLDHLLYSRDFKIKRLEKLEHRNFEFLLSDVESEEFRLKTLSFLPQIVINEAGLPGQVLSWTEIDSYAQSNFLAAYKLGQIAKEINAEVFVQASTSSIYGLNACGDENLPKNPASPYGVTKMAAEHVLSALLTDSETKLVTVRYFSVFGPSQRSDMGIYKFIEAALNGRPVHIFGDGEQSRDFTFIRDAVAGTLAAATHGEKLEAYNISGGYVKSVNAVLNDIEDILGTQLDKKYIKGPKGDQNKTLANTLKAKNQLGWEPKTNFYDGLIEQIEWQKQLYLN